MSRCGVELPDGRARRFEVTAAAVKAQGRRSVQNSDIESSTAEPVSTLNTDDNSSPAPVSKTREICISMTIVFAIVSAVGVIIAVVD